MIELLKNEMNCLSSFRKDKSDVVLWSCIEGIMGKAYVDNKDKPTCAVVFVADFCYLLGQTSGVVNEDEIGTLLEDGRGKVIVVDYASFVSLLEKLYPNNLKKFMRYAVETAGFDKERLSCNVKAIEPEFHVESIGEAHYQKVIQDPFMADCCSNYSCIEDFMKYGLGFAVFHNGEIISAASSYSSCEGGIEITIGTKDEYRRKGLGLAVASKLILECLNRNIYPRWEAANLASVTLAEKLGYHFDKEFEVYSIS